MGLNIYTFRLTKTKKMIFFELDNKQVVQFKEDGCYFQLVK